MFVFFSSRMGCFGSLLFSVIVTLLLIALLGGMDGCGLGGGGGGSDF
ncbi:hypothetical protein [Capillimicrobium parvum]|uniref:Uncharacterized protein n=1 Tax=Capillimicrobium parvum TaxID=2884022 RepID=A0A9E6XVM6_9ACTN|nr:hypothetical protein [Capillimicrobium parvum]UGS35253.1 hypothetical protein DSM104329_01640 [Capillimicrobium parvum]